MLLFEPIGPFVLPAGHSGAKKYVDPEDRDHFWKKYPRLAKLTGCYIFGIRAAKGWTPYYIGKTKRSFEEEALNDRNLVAYVNKTLAERNGTPIMYFVAEPTKRGRANSSCIAELERYLIEHASEANPGLRNKQGTASWRWGIRGILRSGSGKRSAAARELQRRLRL